MEHVILFHLIIYTHDYIDKVTKVMTISLPDPFCCPLNLLTHTSALERLLGERMRCKFYFFLLYCLFSGNRSDNKRVLDLKDTSL